MLLAHVQSKHLCCFVSFCLCVISGLLKNFSEGVETHKLRLKDQVMHDVNKFGEKTGITRLDQGA